MPSVMNSNGYNLDYFLLFDVKIAFSNTTWHVRVVLINCLPQLVFQSLKILILLTFMSHQLPAQNILPTVLQI